MKSKFKIFIKRNKFPILAFIALLIIVFMAFKEFYGWRLEYDDKYKIVVNECYDMKNTKNKVCKDLYKNFNSKEELNKYIDSLEPNNAYENLDSITLTLEIVENGCFSILQFFSPLIIIIAVIGKIHPEYATGSFKNNLTRMTYKDYLKKNLLDILKISTFTPIILILVFLISCIYMKFDFSISEFTRSTSIYEEWKYNNFFIYGIIICSAQFILNFVYGLIGLYASLKNKNIIVASIIGYIYFIVLYLFVYIILYCFIINKIFGFKELTEYFSLTGYWYFSSETNFLLIILIPLIILAFMSLFIYKITKNKEGIINNYEIKMES